MAINKTTTETKNKIKANSVIALPNRPQIPAEQLKQAFVKPIVDTTNSMIQELDRIVEETNAELGQVQVDITNAIDEHNTDIEATHLDIRQEITDLDNDLQGQIDVIDGTLQNHKSRIGELEQFADNLETNITEEIEDAVENKVDLVDGKVPREQLPSFVDDIIEGFYINGQFYSEGEESPEYLITPEFGKLYVDVDTNKMYRFLGGIYEEIPSPFELTKAKVEAVLTGDITSHNHATEIGNHDTSGTAHTNIRNAVAEAKAIAEGKSRARVFATKSALDTWLSNPENVALLLIGDNFYIEETDKPDYWWNGTTIKELETQKVDLTEYAKKTELLTLGTTSNDAYRGDLGQIAYNHSQSDHAPTNAQANVIEGVQVNGVDLSVANKKVNVTVPTIPNISLNDNQATAGKYISKIEVDETDKHKLVITKADLPTVPTKTSDLENNSGFITSGDLPTLATVATSGSYTDLSDKPTIPTIPNISITNGSAESGKYISQVAVDETDKHKLVITKADLPQGFSGDYEDLTNVPDEFTPSEHNHDSEYYKKSETYTKAQIDTLVGDLAGETQELKSITTEPSGTFVYGDLYYNSSTKGLYYYTGSAWELTGLGEPIAGVIYSFNGTLYFWNETEADLIQIGGGVDLSNYYTKTEIDAMFNNLLGGEY